MRSREPTVRIVPVYRRNPKEHDANEKCPMGLMDLTAETFGRIRDAIDESDCGGKAAVLADRGIGNSPSPLRETGNLGDALPDAGDEGARTGCGWRWGAAYLARCCFRPV